MNSPLEIINPLECGNWNDLVVASPGHSFFHSSNWARVLNESYGYKPVYLVSIKNDKFAMLLPLMDVESFLTGRRGVSLPFSDYCEPIVDGECPVETVLERLIEFGRESCWKYVELRGSGFFGKDVSCYLRYYDYVLRLSEDEENVASGFRDSTRRNIQKALRQGVEAEIFTSAESVEEYYRLHCMTRKWHGVPPQPYHFFEKVHEHVISNGKGMVVLASHKGKYVAGAVFFHLGDRALCKFVASDRRCQELRANNLVMWTAIRWYAGRGYGSLSLGRTEPGADGLRQFKTGWGVEEQILNYYKYDFAEKRFIGTCPAAIERSYPIFRAMPVLLLKMAGKMLYRHIG